MKNAAAISAQLVDVRNVGQHKCVKLTLHVPAEQASMVMAAFGWPTQVDPVPVAIARLNPETVPASGPDIPARTHKPVAAEKKLAQLAGILSKEPLFHRYIEATTMSLNVTEETAAEFIRGCCHVKSRSHITLVSAAGNLFLELYDDFVRWRDADKYVEALA
jgi:hypothetical protein